MPWKQKSIMGKNLIVGFRAQPIGSPCGTESWR